MNPSITLSGNSLLHVIDQGRRRTDACDIIVSLAHEFCPQKSKQFDPYQIAGHISDIERWVPILEKVLDTKAKKTKFFNMLLQKPPRQPSDILIKMKL